MQFIFEDFNQKYLCSIISALFTTLRGPPVETGPSEQAMGSEKKNAFS